MAEKRVDKISYVTVAGALLNVALCAIKTVAGVLGHSSAMVADAVHSLSDLVSDAVVLIMVRISSNGQDKNHDYGHGKFETLATVCVSILLLVIGVRLMSQSIKSILFVINGGEIAAPGQIAFWAALVSIVVKEFLFQWTAAVGRRENSSVVIANAWHHRSDALSSVGAALGIGGAILFGGKWTVLDPAAGCIISIVLIVVAVRIAAPAVNELTDASLPDDVENRIAEIIMSVSGIKNVHDLKTRRTGPDIVIDVHVLIDADESVAEAHNMTEAAEEAIRQEFGQRTLVNIHVEPYY